MSEKQKKPASPDFKHLVDQIAPHVEEFAEEFNDADEFGKKHSPPNAIVLPDSEIAYERRKDGCCGMCGMRDYQGENCYECEAIRLRRERPLKKTDGFPSNAPETDEIESLAKTYHEICREMINKQIGLITKPTQPYIEWDSLTNDQKDGRCFIARQLLERYIIVDRPRTYEQCP